MVNMKKLVWASIAAGVFAGFRGSIFTVVGARVNVRLRVKLMDALLSQDIGFFDVTKTGDITSRLSSDTTLVGDQVSLNVNVFLRSLVQALGVLLFMFLVSWQLSILAFISVPLVTLLSKWYGEYVRSLTKLMQQKLADGNSVSEAALGSMATVRAFDAGEIELSAFEDSMSKYLQLNNKAALAYCGYATMSTSCPQLVFAIVVFYGGMLVRNGDMTSGQLVSFLLYLQSLSDAFATIGWVFSSLTQAVGAADKVFELMHRNPRMTCPAETDGPEHATSHRGILGIEATKTRRQRMYGRRPENARGEIVLENVEMYYPARPKRRVLDGLSLKIYPGSVVALVGPSGGGKSSVMSLIQHLYEQSSGRVLFDGMEVHEICPAWLSRNVSIVSQEPTLFARSIKKNIMYGLEGTDSEPSDEEIVEAAKLANADSFIQQMPQKYETEVGERGVALSGGQKQR
jgi:ATP-binding cassette subfamily B (MDR/TAP) protein 9